MAKFLKEHGGLSKEKIGEYLGEINSEFNMDVLEWVWFKLTLALGVTTVSLSSLPLLHPCTGAWEWDYCCSNLIPRLSSLLSHTRAMEVAMLKSSLCVPPSPLISSSLPSPPVLSLLPPPPLPSPLWSLGARLCHATFSVQFLFV